MPEFPSVDAALDWVRDAIGGPEDAVGDALWHLLHQWKEDSEDGMVVMTLERFNDTLGAILENPEDEPDLDQPDVLLHPEPTATALGPTEFEVELSATVFYKVKVTAADTHEARSLAAQMVEDGYADSLDGVRRPINIKVIGIQPVED